MDPVAIILLLVGAVICIFGYRIFTDALPLWGAVVGGAFAVYVSTLFYPFPGGVVQAAAPQLIALSVGVVLGLVLSRFVPFIIVFITGAAMGGLVTSVGYPMLMRGQSNLVVVVLVAAVAGVLAVRFQEVVMIVSTAFAGALAVVYSIRLLTSLDTIWLVLLFFLLGFGGAATQYKDAHP